MDIRTAIVVDDGYDEVPQVDEVLDEGAWESFFDDAYGEALIRMGEVFPGFDPDNRDELKRTQEFVSALWKHREELADLLGDLFESYEQKTREVSPFLRDVEEVLEDLGVSFERVGREFVEAAVEVDLIIIDLFLGIKQGAQDRKLTVDRLKEVIDRRLDRPLPLIILMSQVPGIDDLAREFRNEVSLHASSFRHIKKSNLRKSGVLKGIILTLDLHRNDSQALATFVESWKSSAIKAVNEASSTLRKIDIDDFQHIRNMLLRAEGINTSSYIIDIFDRVLQYEIEAGGEVLQAATALDNLSDDVPPLMISNDRDAYSIIEKTLYVNLNRRSHNSGIKWPITFGDILGLKEGCEPKIGGLLAGRRDLVFLVVSPECDFIREGGLKSALLIPGTLRLIEPYSKLKVSDKVTPILSLNKDDRYQVEWDFKDLRSITLKEALNCLHSSAGYMSIVAKFREGVALNIRQKLLSDISRIGEPAPLPRSMCFEANLFFLTSEKNDESDCIKIQAGESLSGNIFVQRKGEYGTLVFDSNFEDDLTAVILELDDNDVARKSRFFLDILKDQSRLRQLFRSGLIFDFPISHGKPACLIGVGEGMPDGDKKPKGDKVATIIREDDFSEWKSNHRRDDAGLIVVVSIESA